MHSTKRTGLIGTCLSVVTQIVHLQKENRLQWVGAAHYHCPAQGNGGACRLKQAPFKTHLKYWNYILITLADLSGYTVTANYQT